MRKNYGPYERFPGTPWFGASGSVGVGGAAGGGTKQPTPNVSFSSSVTVKSTFSANPGVLVSGRRPDRPGFGA